MMMKFGFICYFILLLYYDPVISTQCCHPDIPLQKICPQRNVTRNFTGCDNWCANIKHRLIDGSKGIVEIYLDPPPNSCKIMSLDCYKIKLLVKEIDNCSDIEENDLTEDDPSSYDRHRYVHSEECVRYNQSEDDAIKCSQDIVVKFHYLFKGCYRLRISPGKVGGMSCYSPVFFIDTTYSKQLVPDPSVDLMKVDKYDVVTRTYWFLKAPHVALDFVKTSLVGNKIIYLCEKDVMQEKSNLRICSNEDCDEDDVSEESHMISSHPIMKIKHNETCNCKWSNAGLMICNFYNLREGYYTLSVEVHDVRCLKSTLWRDFGSSHGQPCRWHKNEVVQLPSNYTNLVKYDPDVSTLIKHHLNIIIPAVLVIILSIIITVFICCKYKRTNRTWYRIVPQLVIHKIQKDVTPSKKVLLLYPRDCIQFMESMKIFRNILESANFRVMDPLDPSIYEEVATSNNTWGLKYLADPSVKVILAASWCSLKLEDGILTSSPLVHSDRLPFDTIFTTLLNQLYLEQLPYMKIFVIRLDCDEVGDLKYKYISSYRNFTLPQCIDSLIQQLLELPPDTTFCINDKQSLIRQLDESIRQYNTYLRDNPNYLDEFLIKQSDRTARTSII